MTNIESPRKYRGTIQFEWHGCPIYCHIFGDDQELINKWMEHAKKVTMQSGLYFGLSAGNDLDVVFTFSKHRAVAQVAALAEFYE